MPLFEKKSIVLYKNSPAIVGERESDKFTIEWQSSPASPTGKKAVYSSQKVREKDVIFLCGPVTSLEKILDIKADFTSGISEARELLLSDEESASSPLEFSELVSIIKADFSNDDAWPIYSALKNSFDFEEKIDGGKIYFLPRSDEAKKALEEKANEKEHAGEIRAAFIERLKQKKILPEDSKYMGDVEALALGKTDKSKTMKEAGFKETPEKAHKLLLDTGIWAITRNPYPLRWGLSMQSSSVKLETPPEEERVKVPGISWAIDSEWSADPDDAIAWDGKYLWVHIADPAATVMPDDDVDKAARMRGATLYVPEGTSRMLSEDSLSDYALGLNEISRALSFRIEFDSNGDIADCQVLRTTVDVKRLTYEKADELKDSPELKPLFEIARRNFERRTKAGAVTITLPEVHISVDSETKKVSIEEHKHTESGDVVREAMLLAGEGAARFAFKNALAFPFVSQEAPEIPAELPEGLAGQYRLRRCMRRRNVSVTPSVHSGLGLGMYSQVTSPLRRYSDLLSHEQLRAFLCGRKPIEKDEMLMRMSAGDAAAQAAHKSERKSNLHWTLVYLLQNPDWQGRAVCVDKQGNQATFMIPSLALETVMASSSDLKLNHEITVQADKIDLPNLEVTFRKI